MGFIRSAIALLVLLGAVGFGALFATNSFAQGSVNKHTRVDAGGALDSNASSVNGGLTVGDNGTAKDFSTVNGSIRLGNGATAGNLDTVNGSIEAGDGAAVTGIETVNGAITFGKDAKVGGSIEAVNGAVSLGTGAQVSGSVSTVNGAVKVKGGSTVAAALKSVNGAITVEGPGTTVGSVENSAGDVTIEGATVLGDVTLEKSKRGGGLFGSKKPRRDTVVLGPGTVIKGNLVVRRPVKLEQAEGAVVEGEIIGLEREPAAE
ncbi:MAG: hypothetical protein SF028_09615 [Candidatus Sumerlaeia bacterium]|nr:hypothetical protein [Candidatus Sumerlaeia bacterium]